MSNREDIFYRELENDFTKHKLPLTDEIKNAIQRYHHGSKLNIPLITTYYYIKQRLQLTFNPEDFQDEQWRKFVIKEYETISGRKVTDVDGFLIDLLRYHKLLSEYTNQ